METAQLERFAQDARRQLMMQVSAKLEQVLTTDSAILRENQSAVKKVRDWVEEDGKDAIIEEAAYTWFNRLCAFRYMDVKSYTEIGIISPAIGFSQPEVLQDAKSNLFPKDWQLNRQRVADLLSGKLPSPNGEQEAYRLLLVAACNAWANELPFLFNRITEELELLMPEDLLSSLSVTSKIREVLTLETCQDVEVIGWLYQFYISEKKDEVMGAKGSVAPEDIPAVTQLFTPDWIVRYMVQNSLGRLWLLNHPGSAINSQMEYYIEPAEPETDFLKVGSPEELKLLDPACGSGHILTYAFDLLFAIYEEQGYDPLSIPRLILEKNLYGIEIDQRAAQLAAFALMMKAMQRDRRFLTRGIQPNVLEMESIRFTPQERKDLVTAIGTDLYTASLWEGVQQFEEAKTYGSLIRPVIRDGATIGERMREKGVMDHLLLFEPGRRLLKVLEMSEYLSPRYHVVVANPPYMGGNKFDATLKLFANSEFPFSKSDLFAMFIERGFELIKSNGYNTMITMQSWMFLSSYESMRETLFDKAVIITMVHMANMVMGIAFGTSATVWKKNPNQTFEGSFSYVDYSDLDQTGKPREFPIQNERLSRATAQDFKKIPGSPIAYWTSTKIKEAFAENPPFEEYGFPRVGMQTSNNAKYLKLWYEVSGWKSTDGEDNTWIVYLKGGEFRRWYGNLEWLLHYKNDPSYILEQKNARVLPEEFLFKNKCTWTDLTSGGFSCRWAPKKTYYDISGHCFFPRAKDQYWLLGYTNSVVFSAFINLLNSSFHFQVGDVARVPVKEPPRDVDVYSKRLVELSKMDWDSLETAWDFQHSPIEIDSRVKLEDEFGITRTRWRDITDETKRLEEENNRLFVEAFGLQGEISPDVPLEEITLTCNPYYRYAGSLSDEEREARLLQDTMKELLSYAVGCMFGRYSLDKPGLILANQGDTLQNYLRQIPEPQFVPTETNVIPILDGDWFPDDISARFKKFLRTTFGDPNFDENLRFIERALGKDLSNYFLKDFYKDHLKTYKKRPIYWLFSSPKGSFNALIYMHRYNADTASIVLNHYLNEFIYKLEARQREREVLADNKEVSKREASAARKEVEELRKMLIELNAYRDQVLFPLAARRIEIDLDAGVVVNHAKFGSALKGIG